MGKKIQTLTGGLRRQGKGGGETSTCLFLQWALVFFSHQGIASPTTPLNQLSESLVFC